MAQRIRRTQEQRTAETRQALMEASVATIQRLGYGGATTAIIAAEAGVTRGALTHHFESRADLMASVVEWVYESEVDAYAALIATSGRGDQLADWPRLLWLVLSQPGGVAVLEILQATRADSELAARVLPVQMKVEEISLKTVRRLGGEDRTRHALARLMVWAMRGLTIERLLITDPTAVEDAVDVFSCLLERAAPSGSVSDLKVATFGADARRPE